MAVERPVMPDRGKAHAGVGEPVDACVRTKHMLGTVREILRMPSPERAAPGREIRKSPRLAVQMPFSYRAIRNDLVMPEMFHGTILNIGYHGMMAELSQPLPVRSEIKLTLDTLLSGAKATGMDIDARAADIYARIIDTWPLNGRNVSGMEFTCVSAQNEKLLMHCMLHTAHSGNTVLDEHLRRHEQETTKKTEAWRVTKHIVIVTLLAVSSALLYLLSILNEALTVVR